MQNAPSEHSAILKTFIKLVFVFKTFVLSTIEWPLKTGFTLFLSLRKGVLVSLVVTSITVYIAAKPVCPHYPPNCPAVYTKLVNGCLSCTSKYFIHLSAKGRTEYSKFCVKRPLTLKKTKK